MKRFYMVMCMAWICLNVYQLFHAHPEHDKGSHVFGIVAWAWLLFTMYQD